MEHGEEPTATFWLKRFNPLRKTKSPFLCCHGNSSAMLWMLCRRLPWSWGEGFLSKKRRKTISEKAVLSALVIPAETGSCSPASGPRVSFFQSIAQLARKGAIAQGSLQVVMQSGSLFKDSNSLRRRGVLISTGISVPPGQDDWAPLV